MSESNEKNVEFDDILELVGSYGRFQKRFNILFNLVFLFLICLPILSLFLVMAVPEHWCYVPGRETTNFTLEEWKEMHIPRKHHQYDSCKMYSTSNSTSTDADKDKLEIVDCQHGWEYDTTYYGLTIPKAMNWVCNDSMQVMNAFIFQRFGDVVGNLIFGQLGDILGRKIVFYATLLTLIIGRILIIFTFNSTTLLMIACFIGGTAASATFQPTLVIAMESSKREEHAHIAMLQCVGWTIGFCSAPLIMWFVGNWIPFILITALPCGAFLFTCSFVVESPRWLYGKGKKAKCLRVLGKIARCNGIEIGEELALAVNKGREEAERTYGIMSLFSHWRLLKNSVLLIIGWSISNLIYYILTLNIDKMGGNPFMIFFWQGLAELPGYVFGKISCDRFGRKWTNVLGYLGTFLFSIPPIFCIHNSDYQWLVIVSAVFLKFFISYSFYAVNLQALEIFPTAIRQTGCSVGGIMANLVGVIGPYIVELGSSINMGIPYIISAILSFSYAAVALFLPETLNEKLPETLADAHIFGRDQPIWHFTGGKKYDSHRVVNDICEKVE